MSDFYIATNEELSAMADAIRQQKGVTDIIQYVKHKGFKDDILSISPSPIKNVTASAKHRTVYYTQASDEVSGRSMSLSVTCHIGDMIVSVFFIRAATYTIPDGWTLLGLSEATGSGVSQRTGIAYKYATSTTESFTVTQDSSVKMAINLVALQGATGIMFHDFSYSQAATKLTVERPSGLILWGGSTPIGMTSAPYRNWILSNTDDIAPVENDQNVAPTRCLIALDQSNDSAITFKTGAGSNYFAVAACTITGMDRFFDVQIIM